MKLAGGVARLKARAAVGPGHDAGDETWMESLIEASIWCVKRSLVNLRPGGLGDLRPSIDLRMDEAPELNRTAPGGLKALTLERVPNLWPFK